MDGKKQRLKENQQHKGDLQEMPVATPCLTSFVKKVSKQRLPFVTLVESIDVLTSLGRSWEKWLALLNSTCTCMAVLPESF